MAHYADLSPCDYFRFDTEGKLLAVGWLEPDQPYTTGKVDQEFLDALAAMLSDPWRVFTFRGLHDCQCRQFPRKPKGFRSSDYDGRVESGNLTARSGFLNLFVPGKRCVYVAPELIMHYIRVHEYCPPKKFQEAVLACPNMLSTEYLQAIQKNGPPPLVDKASDRIRSGLVAKHAVEQLVTEKVVLKEHAERAIKILAEQVAYCFHPESDRKIIEWRQNQAKATGGNQPDPR